jgi:hypothetical protein
MARGRPVFSGDMPFRTVQLRIGQCSSCGAPVDPGAALLSTQTGTPICGACRARELNEKAEPAERTWGGFASLALVALAAGSIVAPKAAHFLAPLASMMPLFAIAGILVGAVTKPRHWPNVVGIVTGSLAVMGWLWVNAAVR